MFSKLPLRLLLTLPYIALLVLLSGAVGWLSYRAASEAVGDMAARLNNAIGERIEEATTAYLSNWRYSLAAAANSTESSSEATIPDIEKELWAAGSLSSVTSNYLYFAAPDGRFIGVQRRDKAPALLKLRERAGSAPRQLLDAVSPGDRSAPASPEAQTYDATQRPWYLSAVGASGDVWSPGYLDFSTQVPMTTLARARRGPDGSLLGVYGADVPLTQLESFLRQLDIAKQGMAYLVSGDGRLIASSLPARGGDVGKRQLVLAADSDQAELASSYRAMASELKSPGVRVRKAVTYETPSGRMLVSASSLQSRAGVDWWVVVALREDVLTAGITRNVYSTLALAALAASAVLVLGTAVLGGLAGDIGKLTVAAEELSADVAPTPLGITRRDELGRLAHAFNRMAQRLESSTDMVRKQNESLAATVAELGAQVQARDAAEGRLRRVADSLTEALIVVDRQWRITYANAKTTYYHGLPPSEQLGRSLWDTFANIEDVEIGQHLREAMASGTPKTVEVYRAHRNTWIELRLFPSELGLAVFFSDVTRRHLARVALAERQRQLHQLAGELLTSQADERREIARELHDEMGQQLAAVRINLQVLLEKSSDLATDTRLGDSLSAIKQLIEQVRNRALDLHPAVLDDLGLGPALQWLCERMAQRLGIAITFQGDAGLNGLPANVELAGFRIAQEAILNAAKHSGTLRMEVALDFSEGHLRLRITDHGHGFSTAEGSSPTPGQSLGLVSMRERAEQLGGTLEIRSQVEQGTTVTVTIPVGIHA